MSLHLKQPLRRYGHPVESSVILWLTQRRELSYPFFCFLGRPPFLIPPITDKRKPHLQKNLSTYQKCFHISFLLRQRLLLPCQCPHGAQRVEICQSVRSNTIIRAIGHPFAPCTSKVADDLVLGGIIFKCDDILRRSPIPVWSSVQMLSPSKIYTRRMDGNEMLSYATREP